MGPSLPIRRPGRQASSAYGAVHVNCTDGRYVYMRAPVRPDNQPLYNNTLMPTHMKSMFSVDELRTAELAEPFRFTKTCPTLKIPSDGRRGLQRFDTLLFDLKVDPMQKNSMVDEAVEAKMIDHLIRLMRENDAPAELFEQLGLNPDH